MSRKLPISLTWLIPLLNESIAQNKLKVGRIKGVSRDADVPDQDIDDLLFT